MPKVKDDEIAAGAVERWQAHGLDCVIRPSPMGTLNGYVRLPEGHPDFGHGYDHIRVDVHGGLTYGADAFGWVGFDTLHLGDWWHDEDVLPSPDREVYERAKIKPIWSEERGRGQPAWTRERLRAEVEELARQLVERAGC